jgi:carboxyl-terminal processing protease
VRLSGFNEKATDEVTAAIKDLIKQNPRMKGLVFDLRNNPGGLLDQAVGISDIFLDGGEVVSQRGRAADDIERYHARPGDLLNGLPVVVLVNSGSASAAEIVAGALQDRKRAEIVGLTSFGKGSVQQVIPLNNGEDGALKITTARYFTPSGRSIQRTGIEPDLEVASTREQAELIATRSIQYSEAMLRNALDTEDGKVRRGAHTPAEAPPMTFDEEGCKKRTMATLDLKCDFQLQRAIDVLRYGSVAATPKLPKPVPRVAVVDGRVTPKETRK